MDSSDCQLWSLKQFDDSVFFISKLDGFLLSAVKKGEAPGGENRGGWVLTTTGGDLTPEKGFRLYDVERKAWRSDK